MPPNATRFATIKYCSPYRYLSSLLTLTGIIPIVQIRKLRLSEVKYCVEWWDCVQLHSPCWSFSGQFYWEPLCRGLGPQGLLSYLA